MKRDTWGDLGNGFYKNPVLLADYSDPDVIRVSDGYYMVCSDFHFMGMPVLYSRDLVNWRIIGQVYSRLDMAPGYSRMEAYASGSWAPSIRYHDGMFYVYFCTPHEGLYMSCTRDPRGLWPPLHEVKRVERWEDPCPFWDEDGNAYLGHSVWGAGPIIIHRMSRDGRELLDDGKVVYVGKVAEGTKIYKRDGYYYLLIPEGGVEKGWQTALRSKSIYGPYERTVMLETGKTGINGPHQGALVEDAEGNSWFLHFQSLPPMGRVCHLQPVVWKDGWPVAGKDGEPVSIWKKPASFGQSGGCLPQTSDDFSGGSLGPQWQWNHNSAPEHWRLAPAESTDGYLELDGLYAEGFLKIKNMLTQKLMGKRGRISVEIDATDLAVGQAAGLGFLAGQAENRIWVEKTGDGLFLEALTDGTAAHGGPVEAERLTFFAEIDVEGTTSFSFEYQEGERTGLGGPCGLAEGFWKGARPCLFTYRSHQGADNPGRVRFRNFTYEIADWAGGKREPEP